MKSFVSQATIFAITAAVGINAPKDDKPARFGQFMAKHNKHYKNSDEYQKRFNNWQKKDKELKEIGNNPKNTFSVGHNKFSDLDDEEKKKLFLPASTFPAGAFAQTMFDFGACSCPEGCTECSCNDFGAGEADSVLDWTNSTQNPKAMNVFSGVTDQQTTNNCWAFAVTQLAAAVNRITNPGEAPANYSEQHLIDCNPYGYGSPDGGSASNILKGWLMGDVHAADNFVLEADYPYTGQRGACNTAAPRVAAKPVGLTPIISTNNPQRLIDALQNGPVMTNIQASSAYFM